MTKAEREELEMQAHDAGLRASVFEGLANQFGERAGTAFVRRQSIELATEFRAISEEFIRRAKTCRDEQQVIRAKLGIPGGRWSKDSGM
jgi:hypothetical protein